MKLMEVLSTFFFQSLDNITTSDYAKKISFSVFYNSLLISWIIIQYNIILWHIDPLLGNDHEINNYATAVAE